MERYENKHIWTGIITYIEYWQIENGDETVVGHENYTKTEVWDMSADNRPTGRKLQQVLTGRIRKVVY